MNVPQFFVKLFHLFAPVEKDALEQFSEKVTPEVLDAAKQGIAAVQSLALGDKEARDTAIEKAKADLVAAGHDIADIAKHEWNAIIEIAYTAGIAAVASSQTKAAS